MRAAGTVDHPRLRHQSGRAGRRRGDSRPADGPSPRLAELLRPGRLPCGNTCLIASPPLPVGSRSSTSRVEVFARAGFHGASMNDIADAAGVTKPVLYQHFDSKRELYLALLDEVGARLLAAIAKATADATDGESRPSAASRPTSVGWPRTTTSSCCCSAAAPAATRSSRRGAQDHRRGGHGDRSADRRRHRRPSTATRSPTPSSASPRAPAGVWSSCGDEFDPDEIAREVSRPRLGRPPRRPTQRLSHSASRSDGRPTEIHVCVALGGAPQRGYRDANVDCRAATGDCVDKCSLIVLSGRHDRSDRPRNQPLGGHQHGHHEAPADRHPSTERQPVSRREHGAGRT